MLAPNYALELSICDYLTSQLSTSGSLLSGSQTVFYTGIGDTDIESGSVVIVDASDMVEVSPHTRNYTFTVDIGVKEIAADVRNKGVIAQAVFNEFVNNDTAKANFTNTELNIGVFNVRDAKLRPITIGDALVNQITVTIEGALIPS
jgi:hypothetical protein